MLTRSKVDYSGVCMKDFITLQPLLPSRKNAKNIKNAKNTKDVKSAVRNIMLFDIESYKITVKNPTSNVISEKWVPHQIAWGVYNWDEALKQLTCLSKKNYYVAEIWINPNYRKEVTKQYTQSFKQHLSQLTSSNYPMKSASSLINKMLKSITRYNIDTLAAYNIHGDFKSLKNLVQYITSTSKIKVNKMLFDLKYSNPFRMPGLNYCDLMHNTSILYMDYLIDEGFKDEKIFRNAKTKQIKLRGRDNTRSIYSAEYVLHKFFNDKQPHIANQDVKLEAKIMKKILKDFGGNGLELNVMYPDKLYNQFEQKIRNEHSQTAYLFKQNANPTSTRVISLKNAKKTNQHPDQNKASNNLCVTETTTVG